MLGISRKEALKLTGRLFTLRRDVNLVSNVLDIPELFWDEASLKALYDAVREYMEIGPRVLNEASVKVQAAQRGMYIARNISWCPNTGVRDPNTPSSRSITCL